MLVAFLRDEDGATAIEYGLIAALIAVVVIAALVAVGTNLTSTYTTVARSVSLGDSGDSRGTGGTATSFSRP